jgi:hypothetical protein
MRRTKRVLTDEQWERIAPYVPEHPRSPKGGRPPADDRECLEGILWLLRTGARWCDIPVDLPSEELDELGELDFDELLADATFIRAKKGAAMWEKPRPARA